MFVKYAARRSAGLVVLCGCLLSQAALCREIYVNAEGASVDLSLFEAPAGADAFSARARFWQDGEAFYVRVGVTDDDLVFSADIDAGDHIELWLAPPPNRFSDNPGNYFYSETLSTRYWIPDDRVAEFDETGGWVEEAIEYSQPCYTGYDEDVAPEVLVERRYNSVGVIHIDVNPYSRRVTVEDTGWTRDWSWQALADAVIFEHFELTSDGYAIILKLPVQALGLVPDTGAEVQRLALDVIGIDGEGNKAVISTAPRQHRDDAVAFNHLRFERPLTFHVDERLPFIGQPSRDLPDDRLVIADATPPYFFWTGDGWSGARIGAMPGNERGDDMCTVGLGEALIPFEGEFSPEAIEYRDYPLDGWKVETYQRDLYINGVLVDFNNNAELVDDIAFYSDAGGEAPHATLVDVFALDEHNLALIITYGVPDRGRFAKGPCAAGATEFLDLVVWSPERAIRHELIVMPTCTGWPRIAREQVSDSEFGWDEFVQAPAMVDAEKRKVVIDTSSQRHEVWLVEIEGDWLTAHRARPKGTGGESEEESSAEALAQTFYQDLRYNVLTEEPEILERLRAVMAESGMSLDQHMLLASVCRAAERVSLNGLVEIAELVGGAPTCVLSHPRLLNVPGDGGDDVDERLALAARLIESWHVPERGAQAVALAYVEAARKRWVPATQVYPIAGLLLDRIGGIRAETRHIDRLWTSGAWQLLSKARANEWTFVLDHAADTAARDSIVEYGLVQYTIDDNWSRFRSLFDLHQLSRDSYLYLLLFAADRPRMLDFLDSQDIGFEDYFGNGDSLLHLVAEKRYASTDRIPLLLAGGLSPDVRDGDGATPLQRLYSKQILGYQGDHEEIRDKAQALIDAGADVNVRDEAGRSPLFHAISKEARYGRNLPMMFAGPLLRGGAELDSVDGQGTGALHHAVALGAAWLVEPLIESGADIDATDARGVTPLMRALSEGQVESAYLLKAAGADPARKDDAGGNVCNHLEVGEDVAMAYALHKDFGCLDM